MAAAGAAPDVVPLGWAANAEPAIKVVATSATANFLNMVFSFLFQLLSDRDSDTAPMLENSFTERPLNAP